MRGAVIALLMVVGVARGVAPADAAITPDRIEAARKTALDGSKRFQRELPRYAPDAQGTWTPQRHQRRGDGSLRPRRELVDARQQHEQSTLSSVMHVALWGLVIVLAMLFALWLGTELSRGDRDPAIPTDESEARMQAAVDRIIERPLGDADELAGRGAYAEAIHTLLLRTLQELVRTSAVRVAPAMTSREILARVPLQPAARDALAGLITAVEITHFGDEPASVADYQRCREQFHVFASALRSQRPDVLTSQVAA